MAGSARVVIVDRHELCRLAVTTMVAQARNGLAVVGEASCAATALRTIRESEPDVVLLELDESDGPDVIADIRERVPHARILVVSEEHDGPHILRALCGGADGFLPKSSSAADILDGMQRLAQGETVLHPGAATEGLHAAVLRLTQTSQGTAVLDSLSPREDEILSLLAQGMRSRVIASSLHLSPRTVESHLAHIYRKLGVRNAVGAVIEFERLGRSIA